MPSPEASIAWAIGALYVLHARLVGSSGEAPLESPINHFPSNDRGGFGEGFVERHVF
jgi:hypothetical protein